MIHRWHGMYGVLFYFQEFYSKWKVVRTIIYYCYQRCNHKIRTLLILCVQFEWYRISPVSKTKLNVLWTTWTLLTCVILKKVTANSVQKDCCRRSLDMYSRALDIVFISYTFNFHINYWSFILLVLKILYCGIKKSGWKHRKK